MAQSLKELNKKILNLENENSELRKRIGSNKFKSTTEYNWSQNIINSIPNPVFIKNEKLFYVAVNSAFCNFVKNSEESLLGKTDSDFFPKEQAKIFNTIDDLVLESGETNWNEEEITIDEEVFNLITSKVRMFDSNGNKYLLGIITDITNNKNQQVQLIQKKNELEKEKEKVENLLMEVHHRVKNNLQIISSLLHLQRQYVQEESVAKILDDSSNRILAMANVHEILYSEGDFSRVNFKKYILSLTDNLKVSFHLNEKIVFDFKMEGVFLNVEIAIPLGMAVNEIITNSIKHAKVDNEQLIIGIKTRNQKGNALIELRDNGRGSNLDLNNPKNSLGVELIKLFCEQIKAKLEIEDTKNGICFKILVPTT